jgi:hypothetical protein
MSKKLPFFENYGHYSSDNYGVNSLAFTIGDLVIYFSYKTPVAFESTKTGLVVRQNDWATTTGKHLNWIDDGDKKARITGEEFNKRLEEALKSI